MHRPRAAVVGVGLIGSLHARVYQEHPEVDLVAVVDVDEKRAGKVANELGVRAYPGTETLLAKEQFDIVSIATPEHARYAPAVACAKAGKHLLLEKPLAPTLREADRLIADIRPSGVHVMVNFLLRFDPRYVRAQALAADGTLGELCTIFTRRRGASVGAEKYAPWTDLLISTGIHDLDAMRWIAQAAPVRVHAEGLAKSSGQWGHDDAVIAVVRFSNGVIGCLETSWVLPPTAPAWLDAALEVVGTGGGVFVEGSNHGFAVVDSERYTLPDLTHWPIGPTGVEGDLRAALGHFVRAVQTNTPPAAGLDEARDAQELVSAAKASIRLERPVELPYDEDEEV